MSLSKHKYLKDVQNKNEAEVWQFPQVVVNFLKVFMHVLLKILTITCGKYVFFSYKAAYSMVTCIVTCLETCERVKLTLVFYSTPILVP